MFEKVLIANRGEVALRIHRACHEMGIKTVVVHSTADSESMAVMLADESVCIGPPASKDSYLNMASILSAAHITGAQAIHPGIGFMAENATFAQMVAEHGLTFIGPSPEHIQVMGDKVSAKTAMIRAGVPVVPGSEGVLKNGQEATALAKEIGFPVLMKAAGGGGGKGMKIAEKAADVAELFDLAQIEAQTHCGNPDVYMEKYLLQPRHIEIQLLGDQHGNVIHLGERDCSLQRRHQKVLEEAPSPALTDAERAHIGAIAVKAAKDIGYYSAGTFEFLYAQGHFYFIEMNTRLQVEHCVTEAITGIDLVKEQLRVAAGLPLSITQDQVRFHGHAIEYRINAEHPETFVPSPGLITRYHTPGGPGVRIDAAIYDGYRVPPFYDSLVSKLVIHGNTRADCLARSRRALDEYVIEGIQTTIPLHQRLLHQPDIQTGHYDIHWLERFLKG